MAASYGVPLPDVSDLIRGFHFEDYANVLLSVADLLPLPAIALARGVAAREMLVLPLRFLAMLLTVLLAVLAKVRAAGVAAGASWFSRHACRLLSDNRKAPKGLLLQRLEIGRPDRVLLLSACYLRWAPWVLIESGSR